MKLSYKGRGFTLVELVMTLVVIGVLAAVAAPRFFGNNVFQSRGFADQVQAALRYAQKTAIAQRRNVCVAFPTAGTLAASAASVSGAGSACDTSLLSPSGQSGVWVDAPSGIQFSTKPNDFKFDALGVPWIGASGVGTSGIIGTTIITVEAETGYVHQ